MSERRWVSKVSDEELLAAAVDAPNMRQLLQTLGIAAYGGNYDSIRVRLERLGALPDQLRRRPPPRLHEVTDEELAAAVGGAATMAGALRTLGYLPVPGLYRQLTRRLREAEIDTSHLLGRSWSRGRPGKIRVPIEELLVRGSRVQSNELRLRLLREGILQPVCACCGRWEWNGRPIPLELDHIDGDRTNNELSNLRLLCPNCHAQTDTYRGRNVGRPYGAAELIEPGAARALEAARARLGRILGAA